MSSSLKPEVEAERLLAQIDASNLPIDIFKIVEDQGLILKFAEFNSEISALIFTKLGNVYIGVNSKESVTRQRFSVAHELGHYKLSHGAFHLDKLNIESEEVLFRDSKSSAGVYKNEIEANEFAASLLMPRKLFASEFEKLNKDLNEVAGKFNVSKEAAKFRAQRLCLLSR